jgi:hypothetical protein
MLKRALPLALLVFAAFAFAVIRLFSLRFEAGDVYPPGSTLRTDPLGSKAFYAALAELPGATVARNRTAIEKLPMPAGRTTVFLLGERAADLRRDEDSVEELCELARRGARVVVALADGRTSTLDNEDEEPRKDGREPAAKKEKKGKKTAKKKTSAKKSSAPSASPSPSASPDKDALWKILGLNLVKGATQPETILAQPGPDASDAGLEKRLPWHSTASFEIKDQNWRVIYRCKQEPVVVERSFRGGSIVLVSDDYLFSNEGLRNEHARNFLTWCCGNSSHFLFDETHLGLVEDTGIMLLARKYHLEPLFGALVILALLFVWKNSMSLVPPYTRPGGDADVVEGKDSGTGFINLLRRSIPVEKLIDVCVEEWKRTAAHSSERLAGKLKRLDEFLARQDQETKTKDPVRSYREISEWITRFKI